VTHMDDVLEKAEERREELERKLEAQGYQKRQAEALERIAASLEMIAETQASIAHGNTKIEAALAKLAGCVESVYNHGDRFMIWTSKEGEA
jgi:hypothetical protein